MIASENFVPAGGPRGARARVLTNKYAEGYPGKRYYGGCEYVDIVEQLAIDRAKELFGAEHANVQPHSGAQANTAVYHALLQPGDTIMGLALPHGGHLTHGMKINVSGRLYDIAPYEVDRETSVIDMDEVERIAERAPAEAAARRLVGLPAPARLRALPRDRRRGRRAADGRHGALRRARRRRPAPQPGAVRRRRHDDDPQDARRRARRHDPLPRGVREEDQLGGLPRPAGRPARARRSPARRSRCKIAHERGLPRAPAAHDRRRPGRRRRAAGGRARRQRPDRRHRRPPRARRPARVASSTASRPRTACTTSASRSTATPSRSTRARRWSRAACASARRRSPPAACRPRTSPRSARSSPPR